MHVSEKKLLFIKNQIQGFDLQFQLSKNFSSSDPEHRLNIRSFLREKYSSHFNRNQLALLSDLTLLPEASEGVFSVSHCKSIGGFSYSNFMHGFDVEQIVRISNPVILRTSSDYERSLPPDIKFLWVAKEAAFKAYGRTHKDLIMTDIICESWRSHSDTGIHSFRITSEKTLESKMNQGFLFSEEDVLMAIYFK